MAMLNKAVTKIGVGVDPEIFLIDKILKRYTSAHDLVPGTKEEPYPLTNGAVQVDGVALEYNTKPAYTAAEFAQYNTEVLAQLRKMLPEDRYAFAYEPAVFFDKVFFDSIPAGPKELGCMPDYNAYTGKQTPTPKPEGVYVNMRTGSGHIHVSWTEGADPDDASHRWDCNYVVKWLENTVGLFMKFWDDDTDRANLYGKPGALRYRPYGVEWRSPSNAWLRHPALWPWLFEAVSCVVRACHDGTLAKHGVPSHKCYGGYSQISDVLYQVRRYVPDFPAFPKEVVKKKKKKKKQYIQRVVRVSGTMTTTKSDVNLDAKDGDVNIIEDYEDFEDAGTEDVDDDY